LLIFHRVSPFYTSGHSVYVCLLAFSSAILSRLTRHLLNAFVFFVQLLSFDDRVDRLTDPNAPIRHAGHQRGNTLDARFRQTSDRLG
jgi:hypothetical protein